MSNRADKAAEKATLESLAAVPLFAECSPKELRAILATGKALRKKAGSAVIDEGKRGHVFFLVLSGTVDLHRDGRPLARLMAGDFFGEMSLLTDQGRNAGADAATDCELFTLTEWAFKSLLLSQPKIAYGILTTVASRAANS